MLILLLLWIVVGLYHISYFVNPARPNTAFRAINTQRPPVTRHKQRTPLYQQSPPLHNLCLIHNATQLRIDHPECLTCGHLTGAMDVERASKGG